jgi:N-acetylmuramoyl-L-alanine amidase
MTSRTTPISYCDADLDLAIRTVDGEARGESVAGQAAVAWVIRNRLEWAHAWWGTSPSKVAEAKYQFSCWNGGTDTNYITNLSPLSEEYADIACVVKAVFAGASPDPTGGATTYKVTGTKASWDAAVAGRAPRVIGRHSFWRLSPYGEVLPFLED